mmetsp:Transcript_103194/g.315746  ORF Transcript_103194/g.315746 Transcript_103194/m.315746 type:complete len:261 (+) Transcript_103194:398-1180(+)
MAPAGEAHGGQPGPRVGRRVKDLHRLFRRARTVGEPAAHIKLAFCRGSRVPGPAFVHRRHVAPRQASWVEALHPVRGGREPLLDMFARVLHSLASANVEPPSQRCDAVVAARLQHGRHRNPIPCSPAEALRGADGPGLPITAASIYFPAQCRHAVRAQWPLVFWSFAHRGAGGRLGHDQAAQRHDVALLGLPHAHAPVQGHRGGGPVQGVHDAEQAAYALRGEGHQARGVPPHIKRQFVGEVVQVKDAVHVSVEAARMGF